MDKKKTLARVSTSFSHREVVFLDDLLKIAMRGGDPSILFRRKEGAVLLRKVAYMRERLNTPLPVKPVCDHSAGVDTNGLCLSCAKSPLRH